MPNQSFSSDIRRHAVAGAQARLTEMAQEADAIRRAFPELRETRGPRQRVNVAEQESGHESDTPTRGRRRRTMSAAQRKAVGERMKKYWAARRAGSQTSAAAEPSQSTDKGAFTGRKQAKTAKRGPARHGPRKVSAAARKRMSQAQKKRWAAKRKAA